jgi:hypothetical protein
MQDHQFRPVQQCREEIRDVTAAAGVKLEQIRRGCLSLVDMKF